MKGNEPAIASAAAWVKAPLLYKGKVRELYDLGEHLLMVVTDRISAFDYVLEPPVPEKGRVLNRLSAFWFARTAEFQPNHVVHTEIERVKDCVTDTERLKDRIMVCRKARRIGIECVVRGYITGGGWRQYKSAGEICGIRLPGGLRKNARFPEPIFTPAVKHDVGHDEDISYEQMERLVGTRTAAELRERSLRLYRHAHEYCEKRGILLADCKFEFGLIDGRIVLIDELLTPDSSRFWAKAHYALDIEIDSMDKEPVRQYLAGLGWDRSGPPGPLPDDVVAETARRYKDICRRLTADAS